MRKETSALLAIVNAVHAKVLDKKIASHVKKDSSLMGQIV